MHGEAGKGEDNQLHFCRRRANSAFSYLSVSTVRVKLQRSANLAHQLKEEGKRVLLVAADTFRAGAIQQLQEWGRRLKCRL